MVRRLLSLAMLLVLVGAAVATAGTGAVVRSGGVDRGAGLVARTAVIISASTAPPRSPLGAALHHQLAVLTRGMRLPSAGLRRRVAHPRAMSAPPALAAPSVCPVVGRTCALHPCVLFAGGSGVVLRSPMAVVVGPLGTTRRGARRRTAVVISPQPRGQRGRRAAGCRRLRAAGGLSIS